MKFKRITAILLLVLLAFSTIGCGKKEKTSDLKGTTLKVIAAYGGKEAIFNKFTEETGIKVEFLDMSSGEVLSRAKAEKGKPIADVWFGGGVDSFIAAKDEGLLEQYISPESQNIPNEYKDKEGYWTGISLVFPGIMVNNDLIKEKGLKVPETWQDLADPQYKGDLMAADPSISGTNYALISGLIQAMGEEKAWSLFDKINANIPFFAKRGGEPPKKVAAGEFAVGIIPMSGESIGMEKKYPVTAIYPKDMIPWVPAPVAIFKNAQNLEAAKVFVDWALSKAGQEFIRDQDPRIMTRKDVSIPTQYIKEVSVEKLIKLDIEKLGKDRSNILDEWKKRYGNKETK